MMNNIKKIFLDELPRTKNGIDWINSKGYKIRFIYDDIDDYIEIIAYDVKKSMLTIMYNNKHFDINSGNLKACKFGNILRKVTSDFKIEIGTTFKDDKRDMIVINRKINEKTNKKYYKYHCNICGFNCENYYSSKDKEHKGEFWIEESHLLSRKDGCSCCRNIAIVENINSIYKTDPWMITYIGEECAKTHTYGSSDRVEVFCPDCGNVREKKISIDTIHKTKSIGCSCSDSMSYPEKFIFLVLEQLELDFQTQLNKTTFNWIIDDKRYDFYFELNNEQYIIETHGMQHYEDCGWGRVKDVQANDKLKKELALKNGIKTNNYIVIDCRYSGLEFIKQNILGSNLNNIFDLNKIDWKKCNEYALSNLIKKACDLWNNGIHSTKEIAKTMKLAQGTIIRYLNQGRDNKWCNYRLENNKLITEKRLYHFKPLVILKDKQFLGLFLSASEIDRQSIKLFGIKLDNRLISEVCRNKHKSYNGFGFKFISDLTKEEYIQYNIENKLNELNKTT